MGRSVGIDLGTTNSCVAVFEGGEPRIMAAGDGSRTVPSVVAFSEDGGRLVGQLAKRQSITNPLGTVSSVKRIIGRRLAEIDTTSLPSGMQLTEGPNGAARVFVHGKARAPEAISAMVLEHLKDAAGDWLGEEVTDAVITVPAYFNAAQRQATSDAGKIAGLNVLRVINEPTAAALAYGIDKGDTEQTVLVFDLGGGTFDVSVLELGDGVFDVKATAGDNHLGGDDFDGVIVEWALEQIAEKNGVDLRGDVQAMQRLYEAAEKAKQELSGVVETSISLPFIASDAAGSPVHLDESLTRSRFEILAGELLERLAVPTEQVIADAGLEPGDLDHVLLVGGMTRMPAVSTRVREITGRDPNRQINPDEAVALGAAIQAEVLSGDMRDVLLLDVTPLSMGIETKGGIFSRLIERNTTIPARATQVFTTAEDNQPSVEIHVLQGEREMARDNRSLGRLQLLGIPPAPRGVPQIEVSFQLDANGMLQVTALDVGTGQRQEATMEGSSGLDEAMLSEMMEEAERFSTIDRRARKIAELRNKADALVYSAEQTITRHGDQLPAEVRNRLLDAVAALRDGLLGGATPEELQGLSDDLTAASHLLADQIYSEDANGGLGVESVADAVVIDEEPGDSAEA